MQWDGQQRSDSAPEQPAAPPPAAPPPPPLPSPEPAGPAGSPGYPDPASGFAPPGHPPLGPPQQASAAPGQPWLAGPQQAFGVPDQAGPPQPVPGQVAPAGPQQAFAPPGQPAPVDLGTGFAPPGYPGPASGFAPPGPIGPAGADQYQPGYPAAGYGTGYAPGYPSGYPEVLPPVGYAPPPGYWPGQPYWGFGGPPRPSGATVIAGAVVQFLQATFGLLVGLAFLFVGQPVDSGSATAADGLEPVDEFQVTGASVAVGVVFVCVAAILVALAVMALRRTRWAAITSIVLQAAGLVLVLVGIAVEGGTSGAEVLPLLSGAAVMILFALPASTRYLESP